MSFNWFTKLFGTDTRHTDALADLFLRNLHVSDQATVRQYIKTEEPLGLTRKDVYTFCLRYPHVAQEIIQRNVDRRKVVKKK